MWLFTIARNKHVSWCRWATIDLRRFVAAEVDVGGPPQVVDELHDLDRALRALPAGHREVLLLVGVEGMDPSQAAQVLGLTPEATRQRLSRARAALTEALGEDRPTRVVRKEQR